MEPFLITVGMMVGWLSYDPLTNLEQDKNVLVQKPEKEIVYVEKEVIKYKYPTDLAFIVDKTKDPILVIILNEDSIK